MGGEADEEADLGQRLLEAGPGGQAVDRVQVVDEEHAHVAGSHVGDEGLDGVETVDRAAVAAGAEHLAGAFGDRVQDVGGGGERDGRGARAGGAARQRHGGGPEAAGDGLEVGHRQARGGGGGVEVDRAQDTAQGALVATGVGHEAGDGQGDRHLAAGDAGVPVVGVGAGLAAMGRDQGEASDPGAMVRAARVGVLGRQVRCAPTRQEVGAEGEHEAGVVQVVAGERAAAEELLGRGRVVLVALGLPEHRVAAGEVVEEVDDGAAAVATEPGHPLAGAARGLHRVCDPLQRVVPGDAGAAAAAVERLDEPVGRVGALQLEQVGRSHRGGGGGAPVGADVDDPAVAVARSDRSRVRTAPHRGGEEGGGPGRRLIGTHDVRQHLLDGGAVHVVVETAGLERGDATRQAESLQETASVQTRGPSHESPLRATCGRSSSPSAPRAEGLTVPRSCRRWTGAGRGSRGTSPSAAWPRAP